MPTLSEMGRSTKTSRTIVKGFHRENKSGQVVARFSVEIEGWGNLNNWSLVARKDNGEMFVSGPGYAGKNGKVKSHCFPNEAVREDVLRQALAALKALEN